MPLLVIGLHTQPQAIKLSVSIFFLGLAISLFCAGPLIDILGSAKIFWLGLAVFFIGTTICYISIDIRQMMEGRLIQGLAVGVLQILSKSLITGVSSRSENLIFYNISKSFTPPAAMVITSIMMIFFPWQASFIFLFLLCLLNLLLELQSKKGEARPPSSDGEGFLAHFETYWELCKDRRFLPISLSYGVVNAIPASFYVTVTYLLTHTMHYQIHVIGLVTAAFSVMSIAGTYLSLLIENKPVEKHIMLIGFTCVILSCLLLFSCAIFFPPSLVLLVAPMLLYSFGASFFYAKFNTVIIENFETISRNVTLSALAVSVALISSVSTLITSFHSHKTIMQTSRLMLMMSLLSAGLFLLYNRFENSVK